jgi:hypothetical protein
LDDCLSHKVLDDSLAVDKLLCQETRGGEHSNTSVLQFLGLHGEHLLSIIGLQAKRVEAKVTGVVLRTEKTRLGNGDILGLHETGLGALDLGSTNGDGQDAPENGRNLGQVGDGRSTDLGIEKEGRSFDLLTNKESDDGKHGNASVGQLGLAVSLHGGFIGLLGESEGIEETDGGKGAGKLLGNEGIERSGLVGRLDRSEGSGRAEEGKEGRGNLHHFNVLFGDCLFSLSSLDFVRCVGSQNISCFLLADFPVVDDGCSTGVGQ